MATVAILVNNARGEAVALAAEAQAWLSDEGHRVRILRLPETDRPVPEPPGDVLSPEALSGADFAVSLGGDGTFLRLAPLAHATGTPVIGVNFGRVGFLLEVDPRELSDVLRRSIAGSVDIESRSVLALTVTGGLTPAPGDDRSLRDPNVPGENGRWWMALNEVVVEKTVPGHMVHISTTFDGDQGPTYRADGVLVATPTGSTAYNLSAGGPVVAPRMRSMIVTPVAPHFSLDRSVVLDAGQSVTIAVTAARPAVMVVDGREVGRLDPGAEVRCELAPEPLRLITVGDRRLGGLLRRTLSPEPDGATAPERER
ncbi:MAG: NAD(+)/NADH kinase [Acidimicrobiales bacterium]